MAKNAFDAAPAAPLPQLPQQASTDTAQPPKPMLPPQPSHGQTVAALRHFDAYLDLFRALLSDPDLGKTSIRKDLIDGMSKLVGKLMESPAKAVQVLGDFPDDPQLQRKWLQGHTRMIEMARDAALDHHRAAFTGVPEQLIDQGSDDHMKTMSGFIGNYRGQNG